MRQLGDTSLLSFRNIFLFFLYLDFFYVIEIDWYGKVYFFQGKLGKDRWK